MHIEHVTLEKERKGSVFIQRLLYTMYISKRSGMDHSFTCKYNMPAFPS